MTATTKKAKNKAAKRERKERRFFAEPTYASRLPMYAGMLGALLLGAGVFAAWVRTDPLPYATYLLIAGAIVFGLGLWRGNTEVGELRVGDAGVALERGSEISRIFWCDIERVSIEEGRCSVRGKELTLAFPVDAHPKATAWLLSEGGRRVPDVIAVKRPEIERFGEPKDVDGELVRIEEVQIAGRHCRESGKPIAFERDARLCPQCGETYLKDHVPKKCLTCQAELGSRAREA